MHAILVLPALAWLLSFANWSERRRLGVVLLAAAGYVALAGLVVAGNVIGFALLDPGGEPGGGGRGADRFRETREVISPLVKERHLVAAGCSVSHFSETECQMGLSSHDCLPDGAIGGAGGEARAIFCGRNQGRTSMSSAGQVSWQAF
jgi:hypothetical protein